MFARCVCAVVVDLPFGSVPGRGWCIHVAIGNHLNRCVLMQAELQRVLATPSMRLIVVGDRDRFEFLPEEPYAMGGESSANYVRASARG